MRNGWSNFSENFRVVAVKLFELTQFKSQNLSIYLRCDVDIFNLTAHAQSICRVDYGSPN